MKNGVDMNTIQWGVCGNNITYVCTQIHGLRNK